MAMPQDKVKNRILLKNKISRFVQICSILLVTMMYIVSFTPIVDKIMSEVGDPYEGFTYNDWVIEAGDRVTRNNEVLKIFGNLIIMPGGNLSLINCEVYMSHPITGSFVVHVQKNETTGTCGELYMSGTSVTSLNQSGSHFYDFIIDGNATILNCDISFVGGDGAFGGLQIYSDDVVVSDSRIHGNQKYGLYITSNPIIVNNEIYDNDYGIFFSNSTGAGRMIRDNEGDNGFGRYISCMWDFNGDSYTDVVISAPDDDVAGVDAGAVYIFYGRPDMSLSELVPFDADIKLFGSNAGDKFGTKLDFSGDLNGDGIHDLVITAPGSGKVYVYFTNVSGFGGQLRNETYTQFGSGAMNNMQVLEDGLVGNGNLILIGKEELLEWYLNRSDDRVYTDDIDSWTDGLSISFPRDYMEHTISPLSNYCSGYFAFNSSINKTQGSGTWNSTYYNSTS